MRERAAPLWFREHQRRKKGSGGDWDGIRSLPMKDQPASRSIDLVAKLGLYTATMIVVGSMIGSGIFKKPAIMATQLHSPGLLVLTWVLAGGITLFGALSNAEIASMMPEAGGQYVFFRRIYNDFVGFLYGWAVFSVIQTGSIASIAYVFAEYAGYFVSLPRLSPEWEKVSFDLFGVIQVTPLASLGVKLLTAGCIGLLTAVNIFGVALGGAVQNVFTTLKIVAILAIVVLAFGAGGGSASHFVEAGPGLAPLAPGIGPLVAALGTGLSGAFWAYDGWNNITYIAGEIKTPARNIPRALFLGTGIVVAVYLVTNLAYLYVMPLARMAGSQLVAADVMRAALGPVGGALISGLVLFSTFGTVNGTVLASARVSYALAKDGLFFDGIGAVHPRYRTPHVALVLQGVWSALLVFSGTFDQLTDMLIFVSWIFYAAGALGVFVMRRRAPDAPRPYRVPGYPIVPLVFVVFATIYVVVSLVENPRNALFGLILVGIGVPLYVWRRWQARRSA
jgi:basic amino acid/polyamine antiporter, APA family